MCQPLLPCVAVQQGEVCLSYRALAATDSKSLQEQVVALMVSQALLRAVGSHHPRAGAVPLLHPPHHQDPCWLQALMTLLPLPQQQPQ